MQRATAVIVCRFMEHVKIVARRIPNWPIYCVILQKDTHTIYKRGHRPLNTSW
jgi:hypothetical protein